ncbi:uncharacterized protein LOC114452983 [Parambassis ranga]|uniref:Uncharacterized protein LOC114452983 n=1 Tax=Parambassis ranga TaxID=210632 RepID=A0A6P7KFR1_9TELE|nr:uncharacterized protein LOC114452983 [Parambassis ranga]XP_028288369.1 uncharacterized protein LOC114452983 [Parambassis ranga]
MGNCCRSESPCGSVEERSGLLKDESKVTAVTGEAEVVANFGCEGEDAMRRTDEKADGAQKKQSPENEETEPNNTQENGPLQKEGIQAVTHSPRKVSEPTENAIRGQDKDVKESPADSGDEPLHCTLNSLQEQTAESEILGKTNVKIEEENPASVQDKVPDGASQTAKVVCSESASCLQTNTTTEHSAASATHNDEEDEEAGPRVTVVDAAAKPSGESTQNDEVLSVPNSQPAAAAGQVSTVVSQEDNTETLISTVTEASEQSSSSVCFTEAGPEDTNSHDVLQSSSGQTPAGVNHSTEEQDSAGSVMAPETTDPAAASESLKSEQDENQVPECTTTSEKMKQDVGGDTMQDEDVSKAKEGKQQQEKEEEEEVVETLATETETGKDAESQEDIGKEADAVPVAEQEDGLSNSEEDLYRGAEELSASQRDKPGPPAELETKLLKVKDRCSLSPAVNILSYSEREWKGNTARSALIKKGYKEMSQKFGSVRRVRGDNYCALRATLFQVLSHTTQLPAWLQEDDITMLPKQLEAQEGLISQWRFPGECLQGEGTGDVAQQLKGYMELLREKLQAAADCCSAAERQQLCERVFQGGEEELGLLEALKLLMLGRAAELHSCMQAGGDVPLFCWLLFARDSSDTPRSFLSNHLSHVGLSAGLEQVEMFLLGYALQCTIQVYRLYKADTEEFVTFYPDDHKDDWQSVCLVTEDDRHYNVPVVEAAELHKEPLSS